MFIFGLFLIEFKNVNIDFKGFLEIKFYFCGGFFLFVNFNLFGGVGYYLFI